MLRRKKTICLIDDQVDEIERFRRFLSDRFNVGGGTSIDQALVVVEKGLHQQRVPEAESRGFFNLADPIVARSVKKRWDSNLETICPT